MTPFCSRCRTTSLTAVTFLVERQRVAVAFRQEQVAVRVHAAAEVEVRAGEERQVDVREHAELKHRNRHGLEIARQVHLAAVRRSWRRRPAGTCCLSAMQALVRTARHLAVARRAPAALHATSVVAVGGHARRRRERHAGNGRAGGSPAPRFARRSARRWSETGCRGRPSASRGPTSRRRTPACGPCRCRESADRWRRSSQIRSSAPTSAA